MRFAWMAVGGMLALLTVTGEAQLGAGAHHYSTDYILGSAPAQPYWICVGATAVPEGEVLTGVVCIGDVTVAGEVRGDVVAIGGSITLEPTALVAGNVTAVCGDVVQARSARVLGEVAAQQLPEVRSIDLPSQGADPSRFHIGDATIRDEKLETVIAIGGTLTIAGASDVANTRVLGGDLVVEGEAKTGSAHVVGGTTTFPGEEPHPANVTEPQVLICSGGSKTPAANGSTTRTTWFVGGTQAPVAQPGMSAT